MIQKKNYFLLLNFHFFWELTFDLGVLSLFG